MKIQHLKRTREQGSVLLVALLTCSIMGVVLGPDGKILGGTIQPGAPPGS